MAVRLGQPNVNAMLRSLTAKQFMEWEAYAKLEPFSEERADWRAASIRQMVFKMAGKMASDANQNRPISDFLIDWSEEPEPQPRKKQTVEQQLALAYSVAMAVNSGAVEMK